MNGFTWTCPHCHGELEPGESRWRCASCGRVFRALRGIPDLRTIDDVYLPNEDDWTVALRLDAEYDRCDFRGLLDYYYDLATDVRPEQRARQITHILTAPGRVRHWMESLGPVDGPILDLGCGSGSFLSAVAADGHELAGMDIAMRWLLLARKRLDAEGFSSIPLACSCAEQLPLPSECLMGIVGGDVIEHVADQSATLVEAHRALAPGGRIFLATPNRYSLAPEPHVGVWGVGYLPRRFMGTYVKMRAKTDFRAIRTLGHAEWRRLLGSSPFGSGDIQVPPLPMDDLAHFEGLKRMVGRIYNRAVKTGLGQRAARRVGPLFHIIAQKNGHPSIRATHESSRATRRRSRPSATPA